MSGQSANAKKWGIAMPIPVLNTGFNFVLQHKINNDFNTFINDSYTSTNKTQIGTVTQDGTLWANNNIYIGVSYAESDKKRFDTFFNSQFPPMLFMEVLDQRNKTRKRSKTTSAKWVHPPNKNGPLNRTNTNYGGGTPSKLLTEWIFTPNHSSTQMIIDNNPADFYNGGSVPLPQTWVNFIKNGGSQLTYQRNNSLSPTGSGAKSTNTFVQPIRFRFGYVADDGRSVELGEPSEQLLLMPKFGWFNPDNDKYVYDWMLRINK